jgi:hypothetical protein
VAKTVAGMLAASGAKGVGGAGIARVGRRGTDPPLMMLDMPNRAGNPSITVTGDSEILAELVDELDGSDGLLVQENTPHASRLSSSILESIVLSATSGAGAVTIRSVLLAVIKKKRIKVSIETATGKIDYEGPIVDMRQLARLADDVKAPESSTRSE